MPDELTAEEMDQEAQVVAERLVEMIDAGMDPGNALSRASQLAPHGLRMFGEVGAGLDKDANKARFITKVLAKAADLSGDRFLPLTEDE